jgi:molybdopterin molybdotransferase
LTARHDDVRMRGFAGRASLEDALGVLRARTVPLPAVRAALAGLPGAAALGALLGRTLAQDVTADRDLPPFRRAAMDGYAVRAAETSGAGEYNPIRLALRGTQLAGAARPVPLAAGEAVRIMTGAAMPDGADAVAMAEYAREEDAQVALHEAVAPSQNVMPVGEDVRRGETVLRAGARLRPQDVALLAGLGVAEVAVRPAVRVAVLPTGNELVAPGGAVPPGEGAVVDTNSTMLCGLCAVHGATAVPFSIVRDTAEAVRAALQAALDGGADVVVVIGGTAVGVEDHVPAVVRALGELPVHGVALKPASPTGLGFVRRAAGDEVPVVLAPGSPVASMIAFDLFVGAAICLREGRAPSLPYPRARGTLARKIVSQPGRTDFVRVQHDAARGTVEPVMTGGASILSSTTRANGLVVVPHDLEGFPAGAEVDVLLWRAETPLAVVG